MISSARMFRSLLALPVVLLLLVAGCRKSELLQSGGDLAFSTDTLTFDTVFTAQGSFTTNLRIYNPNDQPVVLSSVRLGRGASSPFRLNVDGRPGSTVTDVEIAANDSAFVFATVKIDPTAPDAPFIVEDRLIATLNGKDFSVPFFAYGQNANYVVDSVLETTTWTKDRPYVILNSAAVKEGHELTIEAGTRVYMHADSRLYVLGSLKVNGTKQDSVVFQGDRLDRAYFGYVGYPGEWGGIYFSQTSTDNRLTHTIIKNCGAAPGGGPPFAIEAYDTILRPDPKLILDRVTIMNSLGYGLLAFSSNVRGDNVLIHSCGAQALALLQGGTYAFNNCTFAVYGNPRINHSENSVAAILNYFKPNDVEIFTGSLDAVLRNCIIWGTLENELVADAVPGVGANLRLENCLVRRKEAMPGFVQQISPLPQTDPKFADVTKDDYHPKEGSTVIDAGVALAFLGVDLDDLLRPKRSGYDVGCYELQ